ncbi:hypothetical protein ABWV95_00680 [Enterococcus faecalis]
MKQTELLKGILEGLVLAKFYRLTPSGEAELADFWQRWTLLSKQVNKMKKMEG